MSEAKILFAYVTCASVAEAKKIGRACVEARLAACANILPVMHAIYRWKDEVQEADEVVLLLKTDARLFDSLSENVRKLHSYDVPCIAGLPVEKLNPGYKAWLLAETGV
jgi:periplasmic divalent cation tolerance protein